MTVTQNKSKNKKALRLAFCLFIWILFTVVITALLVDARLSTQMCFVLDIISERVPNPVQLQMVDGAHTPFGIGHICVDEIQREAHWNISETFRHAYPNGISDVLLHGPLAVEGDVIAPVTMAMGVHRDSRQTLSGSSILSLRQIGDISDRPELFYVAFYSKNSGRSAEVEIARSKLMRPKLKK
jgi:hypothetical protein